MKTNTTFNLNSENISNAFKNAFDNIQETKLSVTSKTGKEFITLPLLIAIIIAIIVPFAAVLAVILGLAFGVNFSFLKTVEEKGSSSTDPIQVK